MVHPGVQIKSVESNPLFPNADFNEMRADLCVEAVPVHPEIEGRVPQPDKAWDKAGKTVCVVAHYQDLAKAIVGDEGWMGCISRYRGIDNEYPKRVWCAVVGCLMNSRAPQCLDTLFILATSYSIKT